MVFFCDYDKPIKFFHKLNFADLEKLDKATDTHFCKLDVYKVIYHFIDKNKFQIFYDVIGPNKKYSIKTLYYR